ncbi:MAG: hypothetical protein P8X91_01670 [Candidatus Bathyarchaeota archaeon]
MTSEKGSMLSYSPEILFSVFYIIVGIIFIGYYAIDDFAAPPTIPVLGILSIIAAYFLFKKQKWTLPLVIILLFTGITFGATTLVNSVELQTFGGSLLFHITLLVYMVILLIASAYIITNREDFK